jgi:hypothetical protein
MSRSLLSFLSPYLSSVLVFSALAFVPQWAIGSEVSYSLSQPNSGLAAFPSPYGTVTIDVASGGSSTATITATALSNSTFSYGFVDGGTVALNTTALVTAFNVTSFTSPTGGTPTFSSSTGNEDGFGSFNFKLDQGNSSTPLTKVVFTITQAGTWADASSVVTGNNSGNSVGGHLGAYANGDFNAMAASTGFANGDPVSSPEPSTMIIGLSSMFGLGMTRLVRRFRSQRA